MTGDVYSNTAEINKSIRPKERANAEVKGEGKAELPFDIKWIIYYESYISASCCIHLLLQSILQSLMELYVVNTKKWILELEFVFRRKLIF
jgi:hypothetical protein